jgi:hypothetical protein
MLLNGTPDELSPPDVTFGGTLANKTFGWLNFRNKKSN